MKLAKTIFTWLRVRNYVCHGSAVVCRPVPNCGSGLIRPKHVAHALHIGACTLFTFVIASTACCQDLELKLQAPAEAIHVGDYAKFIVTIANNGKEPVTLVEPGDGSECKWRTPVIGWSVLPAEETQKKHPDEPPLFQGGRCGNMNALSSQELFTLKSGNSKRLEDWMGHPTFANPGKFRMVFFYQNIPDLKTSKMGGLQPEVLEKLKSSQACLLKSNEIVVEVLPKKE